MENNLWEFYTNLNFIAPNTISWQDMETHFIYKYGFETRFRNLELFNQMASKVMYRVTKKEVKDNLPKLTQDYRFVEHSDEAQRMKLKLIDVSGSFFEIYTTLRVLDSYMNPTDSVFAPHLKKLEHKNKLEELLAVLDEIGNNQILIFTSYEKTAIWLCEVLTEKYKYKAAYVSSGVKDKDDIQDSFIRGDIQIVIATDTWMRGVDLPTINYMINWDFPTNPASYAQRRDRIYRINSEFPKLVINFISNIIENDIFELVKDKIENIEKAVEGVTEGNIMKAIAERWGIKMNTLNQEVNK
jgi:superfamily II DNA/RNA helicase